jgi:hypothetical protein
MELFTEVGYDNFRSEGARKINVRLRVNMAMLGYVDDDFEFIFQDSFDSQIPISELSVKPA